MQGLGQNPYFLDPPYRHHRQANNDVQCGSLKQRGHKCCKKFIFGSKQIIRDHYDEEAAWQVDEHPNWKNDRSRNAQAVADVERSSNKGPSAEPVEPVG